MRLEGYIALNYSIVGGDLEAEWLLFDLLHIA
jgi:hypothetical protein